MSQLVGSKWEDRKHGRGQCQVVGVLTGCLRSGGELFVTLHRDIDGVPFLCTTDERNLKLGRRRRRDLERMPA